MGPKSIHAIGLQGATRTLALHGEYVVTYYCGAATRIRIRVFRLVYLVYDMHAYICKVTVFTKQAEYE